MKGAAQAGLPWRPATLVGRRPEAAKVATLALDVPGWPGHLAGQHVDVRLSTADGYQAQRSYSIASARRGTHLELTVEEVRGGEVSPFLLYGLAIGDSFELRGPIGGYFTWQPCEGGPLLLVAGGSGIVPLMAMLRERAQARDSTPVRLVYSARQINAIIFREELDRMRAGGSGFTLTYTLTRQQPPGWTGESRRIDRAMLESPTPRDGSTARAYVCGPTLLVEQVAQELVALGYDPGQVRTERFGPTGDAR